MTIKREEIMLMVVERCVRAKCSGQCASAAELKRIASFATIAIEDCPLPMFRWLHLMGLVGVACGFLIFVLTFFLGWEGGFICGGLAIPWALGFSFLAKREHEQYVARLCEWGELHAEPRGN
jgi:hypothetical protein